MPEIFLHVDMCTFSEGVFLQVKPQIGQMTSWWEKWICTWFFMWSFLDITLLQTLHHHLSPNLVMKPSRSPVTVELALVLLLRHVFALKLFIPSV